MHAFIAEWELSAGTQHIYKLVQARFARWCANVGVSALPAEGWAVAAWCAELAAPKLGDTGEVIQGLRSSTIQGTVMAVKYAHFANGHPDPTVTREVVTVLAGIDRSDARTPTKRTPFDRDTLRSVVERALELTRPGTTTMEGPSMLAVKDLSGAALNADLHSTHEIKLVSGRDEHERLTAYRDVALILVGYAGALRCSEITELRDEDLHFGERGVVIHIRRSKEDQAGVGAYVGIPNAEDADLCPVRALQRWLAARGTRTTYVFPGIAGRVVSNRPYSVSVAGRMVKARTGELGIPGDWGTHSMRRGFCTSAARAGATLLQIGATTRHSTIEGIRGYIAEAELEQRQAPNGVGL
jgi:integrase